MTDSTTTSTTTTTTRHASNVTMTTTTTTTTTTSDDAVKQHDNNSDRNNSNINSNTTSDDEEAYDSQDTASSSSLVQRFPAFSLDEADNGQSVSSSSLRHLVHHHSQHHMHLPPPPHRVRHTCRIGIMLWNVQSFVHGACRVMDHAISFCKWAALCVWEAPTTETAASPIATTETDDTNDKDNNNNNTKSDPVAAVRSWLRRLEATTPGYGRHADTTPVYVGSQGAANMLATAAIDAVYVMVPQERQSAVVLQCLRSNKHVLIKDWQSTALSEFRMQVQTARAHQRFVQFSTMFDIQYNVQAFLDTTIGLANSQQFGHIVSIKAELEVGPDDWSKVGVRGHGQPGPTDSCIVRLARYCVLMGLLLTPAETARPQTAQITSLYRNEQGVPLHATAKVWFASSASAAASANKDNKASSQGRCFELKVGYSPVRTHQWVQVSAAHHYAVLTEFALPSTHGLHSFRIYDTGSHEITPSTSDKTCWEHVKAGEALDVPCGLPQHVMMWRRFAELCQSVERQSSWDANATFLTHTAMALKATLLALETSAAAGNDDQQDYPVVPIQWD